MTRRAMWARIVQSSECWEWHGAKTPAGYAVMREDGRNRYVHRIVYEALRGPIPADRVIDHLCRNPGCVNPDHLEPVPHRLNILRGKRALNAVRTHCCRGHRLTPETEYIRADGARCCKRCARRPREKP